MFSLEFKMIFITIIIVWLCWLGLNLRMKNLMRELEKLPEYFTWQTHKKETEEMVKYLTQQLKEKQK